MSDITVGMEIVAIKSHKKNYFKRYDTFPARGVESLCSCPKKWINIGIAQTCNTLKCKKCGTKHRNDTGFMWFSESYFRPIDDIDISDVDSVLQEDFFEFIERT